MTNDLQAISDGLRVKLLGEDVEYPEHDFRPYCTRCGHSPYKQKIPCRPDRPLLSADPEYHRVLSAMDERGWVTFLDVSTKTPRKYMCGISDSEHNRMAIQWGATRGEAIVRAAWEALGGE